MGRLTLTDLHKHYGDTHAVKGVSLDIPEGEFAVLVGPSGCGKSTLLRSIAGLENIDQGTIAIDDEVVNDMRPRDRNIAMVFQNYALYPYMSVYDNIAFGLRARNAADSDVKRRVAAAAEMLGIETLLDRLPRQLSGGQRQRVAMGRAMVRTPKVFLFDEPLSNLDAKLRGVMREEIKQLHRELKTTTIYVTHDQIEAMTLADRIAVMKDGELQQLGTPKEIYNKPNNMFVAGFMGSPSMNFIYTTVDLDEEQNPVIKVTGSDDVEHQIRLPQSMRTQDGKKIVIGLRPEHITDTDSENMSAATRLGLTLEVIEPTGPDIIAMVKINGQEVACRLSPEFEAEVGETASLNFDLSRAVYFDAETEQRIDFD